MAASVLHPVGNRGMGTGSVRRLGTVLRERAWLIFLCVLFGGALATAYMQYAPKQYAATTTVRYRESLMRYLGLKSEGTADLDLELAEVVQTLKSRPLIKEVVLKEQLHENPRFRQGLSGEAAVEQAVDTLLDRLTVEIPADDRALRITFVDRLPDLAVRVANSLVVRLLENYARQRADFFDEVNRSLQTRNADILKDLRALELTASSGAAQVPQALQQKRVVLEDALQSLTTQRVEADVQLARLREQLNAAQQKFENPESALQVTFIADYSRVDAARKVLLQQQLKFEEITERYREKHPDYIAALEDVQQSREALGEAIQEAVVSLEQLLESSRSQRDDLQRQVSEKMDELAALPLTIPVPDQATTSDSSTRDVLLQLWKDNLAALKGINYSEPILLNPLKHLPASAAVLSSPTPPQLLAYGFSAGFLVGVLLCLVFGYGDTSLKTVEDLERTLDLPVLSVVPRLKDSDSEMAAAEGFRSLRTSIAVSSREKEPRLIQFTSTSPDEGKTFCALNFAVGLAQQGHRTVLVECDLRRPMAAPSLTLVRVDAAGVSDYLKAGRRAEAEARDPSTPRDSAGLSFAEIRKKKTETGKEEPASSPGGGSGGGGSLTLEDIVQRTEVGNLFFVAAGKPVSSPTELLGKSRFEDLLDGLLQRYDRVVLDSAPVLGVSETLLIASRMHGVCFVVRGSQTPRRAVIRAIEILRRADVPLLGAVLNGITPKKSDPYGQDYYYHRTGERG